MKVIVCGAGQVGVNIAHQLALEQNDVTVIDRSAELVRHVNDTLDANGIVGHASRPDVLERAGIADADMIIAVTLTDEINMVACQVAHSLFDVPVKIARIRQQDYLAPIWAKLFSRDHLPIDVIISPEMEVARAVARRLQVPGATEMIPLANGKVRLIGVRCGDQCPVVNTPLRQLEQLFPDLTISVVGLMRGSEAMIPRGDDQMLPGDEVFFVIDAEQVPRAMAAFGAESEETKRLVILGGGNIGLFLAQELEDKYPWVSTKIIESSRKRAARILDQVDNTLVLHGDARDRIVLEEANIAQAEAVVAVTNDDETNILGALLAKKFGCGRAISLVNGDTYDEITSSIGVDVVVSPRDITVSTILQHVRRGRIHAVHRVREGLGELIEAEALETSDLVGKPIREVDLPEDVIIGAIVRGDTLIAARGGTIIEAHDRVILFSSAESVQKVEKMFSVQLEFF